MLKFTKKVVISCMALAQALAQEYLKSSFTIGRLRPWPAIVAGYCGRLLWPVAIKILPVLVSFRQHCILGRY